MKTAAKATLICTAVACGALLFVHRRVIAAAINGDPMPEPPEWHREFFPCFFNKEEDEDEGWS